MEVKEAETLQPDPPSPTPGGLLRLLSCVVLAWEPELQVVGGPALPSPWDLAHCTAWPHGVSPNPKVQV
jgi:hypothetical protein